MVQFIDGSTQLAGTQIQWLSGKVQDLPTQEIEEGDKQRLLGSLQILKYDLKKTKWYMLEKKLALFNLSEILAHMVSDQKLSRQELDYWLEKFADRENLSKYALEEYRKRNIR